MNLNKVIRHSILVLFFASVSIINAIDDGLEYLVSDRSVIDNDPALKTTMNKVFESLKGSWCSKEKAKLIMELIIFKKLSKCVDIGTFSGDSALPMLIGLKHLNKKGRAYLIDAWSNEEAVRGLKKEDQNAVWWSSLDMDSIKSKLLKMLKMWKLDDYCTIIHATSEKAASDLDAVDFLHLDGNFSEQGALLDTNKYLPKVKSGGYILLSNILVTIDTKMTKMKALWPIFDACEMIGEIEGGNVILFQKK